MTAKSPKLWAVAGIIALGFVAIFVIDYRWIADKFRAIGYAPSDQVRSLISDIAVTDRADTILWASRPSLQSETDFNQTCQSHNPDISVLGCYVGDQIYVYNVENPELAGIQQSTLAHELLHAVWARLPESERTNLAQSLQDIYEQRADTLESRLENYPESSFYDELHSIIGTEITIADQPENLRAHYANYFDQPDQIIDYYTAYSDKFADLKAEAEQIHAKIEANRAAIKSRTETYDDGMTALNAAITDFNRRATNGYFSNTAAFNTERASLVRRQQTLSQNYDDLSELIAQTNQLITDYNQNVARSNSLMDSINSNTTRPAEIKD